MRPYIVVADSPIEAIKAVTKQDSRLAPNPYDFDVHVIDANSFTEPTIILQGELQHEQKTVSDAQLSLAETQFMLMETYYVLINRRIKDLTETTIINQER